MNPPNMSSAARRSGTTYTYELAIPGWDNIDQKGTGVRHDFQSNHIIGLTIVFSDFESAADADGMKWHAWNGLYGPEPVVTSQNADEFTDFLLK